MASNTIKAYINGNGPYECVYGATFSDEYNETLNSGSIILANLSERITPLAPYMQIRLVFDDGRDAETYLVESFSEEYVSPSKGIWTYTIRLMSLTKLLEKVQCPNLCVTHGSESRRTILEVMKEWVLCYNIKVAYRAKNSNKYALTNMIAVPTDDEAFLSNGKFDVPCGDLQLSVPTLRQALTTLMAQVSCIPTLKADESGSGIYLLSYLDFSAEQTEETLTDDMIATRSQGADGYANVLYNASGNMLDDDATTICEKIHFTDRSNLLLKHLENLKLETRFPIYKVKKLTATGFWGGDSTTASKVFMCVPNCYPTLESYEYARVVFLVLEEWECYTIAFVDYGTITDLTMTGTLSVYSASGKDAPILSKSVSFTHSALGNTSSGSISTLQYLITDDLGYDIYEKYGNSDYEIIFYGDCSYKEDGNAIECAFVVSNRMCRRPDAEGSNYIYAGQIGFKASSSAVSTDAAFAVLPYTMTPTGYTTTSEAIIYGYQASSFQCETDLTPLVKEASAKSGLNLDYTELSSLSSPSIDDLAKYYYSTLSYDVGGTSIEGFSQNYSVTNGWWSDTQSVIEKIVKLLTWTTIDLSGMTAAQCEKAINVPSELADLYGSSSISKSEPSISAYDDIKGYYGQNLDEQHTESGESIINPLTGDDTFAYATLTFDLEYVPLLQTAFKATSKEIDTLGYPIEQYDSKQSGLSSFQSTASSEYDSVKRITSDILSIRHRTATMGERLALNSRVAFGSEEYIIFKRTSAVYRNDVMTTYMASRDYVMKNYYTSIMTKYRAYQYVDYSSSTLRHETLRYFINVGYEDPANHGISLLVSSANRTDIGFYNCQLYDLLDGAFTKGTGATPLTRRIESWNNTSGGWYQDEISVATTDNMIVFTSFDFDNASLGIYIDGAYMVGEGKESTDYLGGLPQKWYEAQSAGDTGDVAALKTYALASKNSLETFASGEAVLALPKINQDPTSGTMPVMSFNLFANRLKKDNAERLGVSIEFEILDHTDKQWQFAEKAFSMSTLVGEFSDEVSGASSDFSGYIITDGDIDICDKKYRWVKASSLTKATSSLPSSVFAVVKKISTVAGKFQITVNGLGISHPVVWAVFGNWATPVMKGTIAKPCIVYVSRVGSTGLKYSANGLQINDMLS